MEPITAASPVPRIVAAVSRTARLEMPVKTVQWNAAEWMAVVVLVAPFVAAVVSMTMEC